MHPKLPFLAALLFVSGFCSLVYQVAWIREFRLIFGGSTPAAAAVVAIFMGGLGLGAALIGKRADRSENPLKLYAQLELGVTLMVAVTPLLLDAAGFLYILTGGSLALGTSVATLVRLLLAALVLGIPCILMGGNLPAAVKFVETDGDRQRSALGLLYGLNATGAVLGAFLTTFWILESLGTRESLYLSCAANLIIGLLALFMASKSAKKNAKSESRKPQVEAVAKPAEARAPVSFVYGAAFLSGFLFFLAELVWFRMLVPLLGASVYAFGLILTIALFGIGAGGVLYAVAGRVAERERFVSLRCFAQVSALQGLAMGLPFALGDRIVVLAYHATALQVLGFPWQILGWSVTACVLVLAPSIIAGFQFPLIVALLGGGGRDVGRQLGNSYAWNTAGAITGSLAGGFFLLPALSAPGCWVLVAVLMIAMAAAALILEQRRKDRRSWGLGFAVPVACIGITSLCFGATGPTSAWRHVPVGYGRVENFPATANDWKTWVREMNWRVEYEFDGRESSVALTKHNGYSFHVNGKADGTVRVDAGTQVMLGLIPALLHPDPSSACVIGLGTGSTAGWLSEVPGIDRLDIIELEPGMARIARDCAPVNRNVMEKANARLIIGDGREILLTRGPDYDIIVSEPSNPHRAGIASLYTREYYRAVRKRLTEGGVFAQWIQGYEVAPETIHMIYATLASVFDSVQTWSTQVSDIVFICSTERPVIPVPEMRRRIQAEPFATALHDVWYTDSLEGVLAHCYANSEFARRIASSTPNINTDNRNLLEFSLARTAGRASPFHTSEIALAAGSLGMRLPPLGGGELDLNRLEEEWRLSHTAELTGFPGLNEIVNPDDRKRAIAMNAYLEENYEGVVENWKGDIAGPMQKLILAEAYAKLGNALAIPMIEKIEDQWPTEALILRAYHAFKNNQNAPALVHLKTALRRLQEDPWTQSRLMKGGLQLAVNLAGPIENEAAEVFDLLETPFSVRLLEERRLAALAFLAENLSTGHKIRAIEAWGPRFPWSENLLLFRMNAYRQAGDPRLDRAEADYRLFLKLKGAPFVQPLAGARRRERPLP